MKRIPYDVAVFLKTFADRWIEADTRELRRDGSLVRTRSWHEDIPRDLQ